MDTGTLKRFEDILLEILDGPAGYGYADPYADLSGNVIRGITISNLAKALRDCGWKNVPKSDDLIDLIESVGLVGRPAFLLSRKDGKPTKREVEVFTL